jgi:hypothetical protein
MGILNNIITEKLAQKKTTQELVDLYDAFMCEYGYIPLEEFKQMPQALINVLVEKINQRRKKNEISSQKLKRGI